MSPRHIILMTVAVLPVVAFAPFASAQDRTVVFAGTDIGGDYSVSGGVTWAPPGSRIGEGWAVRGIVSAGGYDYDRGPDRIEADFVQADVALLHQRSGAWGYFNVGAGTRLTETDLEPSDPGNGREGTRWDVIATADGALNQGPWRLGGFGVYGIRMNEYYVRGDVTRAVGTGPIRLGAEVLADGDDSYDRQRFGLVAMREVSSGPSLRGAVGVRDDGDVYVSFGLSRSF